MSVSSCGKKISQSSVHEFLMQSWFWFVQNCRAGFVMPSKLDLLKTGERDLRCEASLNGIQIFIRRCKADLTGSPNSGGDGKQSSRCYWRLRRSWSRTLFLRQNCNFINVLHIQSSGKILLWGGELVSINFLGFWQNFGELLGMKGRDYWSPLLIILTIFKFFDYWTFLRVAWREDYWFSFLRLKIITNKSLRINFCRVTWREGRDYWSPLPS